VPILPENLVFIQLTEDTTKIWILHGSNQRETTKETKQDAELLTSLLLLLGVSLQGCIAQGGPKAGHKVSSTVHEDERS
jgi:hypothetical protein